jgi:hypothetical protein
MRLFRAFVLHPLPKTASTTTLIIAFFFTALVTASAHDSWISRGKFKNAANEWCCGDIDCEVIPENRVHPNGVGYDLILDRTETVPYAEALPSQDGQYWRCHRPDGSRRCFFAPEPSM